MKNENKDVDRTTQRSGLGQVSLINEIIKREKKFHAIYTTFTLNLKRLNMITEKPTNFQKEDSQKKSEEIPEYIKNKIKYHFKTPYEKYCSPMTSSQEFGWDKSEKLNWNMRRHPKNSCDVTKYTDEYLALKGQSPYILKKAAVAEKQK